jgi:hypothetical protein
MTMPNSQLDIIGGGLAPSSQTLGALLRTPGWQIQQEKLIYQKKWIRQSYNFWNHVPTTKEPLHVFLPNEFVHFDVESEDNQPG